MIPSQDQLLSNINFFSEEVQLPSLDKAKVSSWIQSTFSSEDRAYQGVNIIFCSDDFLLRLNKEHLHHDYYTDIITFEYQAEPIQGELYISIDRVKENAETQSISFLTELHRVIIHGVLHLIGYGDKTDEEKDEMRKKEDYYLQEIL